MREYLSLRAIFLFQTVNFNLTIIYNFHERYGYEHDILPTENVWIVAEISLYDKILGRKNNFKNTRPLFEILLLVYHTK